jgi:hypothetical protein
MLLENKNAIIYGAGGRIGGGSSRRYDREDRERDVWARAQVTCTAQDSPPKSGRSPKRSSSAGASGLPDVA